MKFADEPSRNLVIRLVHMLDKMPKFLSAYLKSKTWEERLKICEEEKKYFDIVNAEEFKKLPAFAIDLENLSFEYIKDQNTGDTILDLFSSMCALNSIFEELHSYSLMQLKLPGGCYLSSLDTLIILFYKDFKYNFNERYNSKYDWGMPIEPIEKFKNKLLTLPNDKPTTTAH